MLPSLYGVLTTGPILFKFKHNLYFRPEYRSKVVLKNIKSTSALTKALFFQKVQICTLQKPGPNFKIGVQTITLKIKNKIHTSMQGLRLGVRKTSDTYHLTDFNK